MVTKQTNTTGTRRELIDRKCPLAIKQLKEYTRARHRVRTQSTESPGIFLGLQKNRIRKLNLIQEKLVSIRYMDSQAFIASLVLSSNQRMVSRSPSIKGVLACQPNSARARVVSRQRRGWPSGFVASHRTAPS
jgi:hypothetical protein